jgi:hypothetical protein
MSNNVNIPRSKRQLDSWLVLVIALALAIAFWFMWAKFGLKIVHRTMANAVIAQTSAKSSETPPNSSESVGSGTDRAALFAELGQSGDAFGSLNTLLTAVAGALVFWAGFMQHRALKHAQEEAELEREARHKQAADMLTTILISERAAKSAEEGNQLARESYIADQRAWIKMDVAVGGPLFYNVNGLNVTLLFRMTNVGKTPALNVFPTFQLKAPAIDTDTAYFDERGLFDEMSKSQRSNQVSRLGFTIFPGEGIEMSISTSMSQDEVERITENFKAIFLHVFCITSYRLVQADGIAHQTGSKYELQRSGVDRPVTLAKNRAPERIWVDEGDIAQAELRLVRSPVTPGFAD